MDREPEAIDAPLLSRDRFSSTISLDGDHAMVLDVSLAYRYDDREIGGARLLLFPQHHRLEWHEFYPNRLRRLPDRCGLGTLAHAATMRLIDTTLRPDRRVRVHHDLFLTSRARQLHLAAMGIPYATPLPLEEYLNRSLRYAATRGFPL